MTSRTFRRGSIVALTAAILLAGGFAFREMRRSTPSQSGGIPSRGGARLSLAGMASVPLYLQTDPRWKADRLGGGNEPLASVGCTVCCLSMALARYRIDIPPGELNRRLTRGNGFTDRGWVKWEAISDVTNGRIEVEVANAPDHSVIDAALRASRPVVAKIMLGGTVQHWVLIVGKEGLDYLIRDPLIDSAETIRLADRAADIRSVRIVGKRM